MRATSATVRCPGMVTVTTRSLWVVHHRKNEGGRDDREKEKEKGQEKGRDDTQEVRLICLTWSTIVWASRRRPVGMWAWI
jgi:hypothetical protein